MKLKNINKKNYKLIKYNIIKSNFYLQIRNTQIINENVEQFEINLKQMLKLISEYNYKKKLIYFIDFPIINNDEKFLQKLKITNHKYFSKEKILNNIRSKGLKKPHLLVIFFETFSSVTLNSFKKFNIPIVLVNKFYFFDSNFQQNNLILLNNKKIKKFIFYMCYSVIKNFK